MTYRLPLLTSPRRERRIYPARKWVKTTLLPLGLWSRSHTIPAWHSWIGLRIQSEWEVHPSSFARFVCNPEEPAGCGVVNEDEGSGRVRCATGPEHAFIGHTLAGRNGLRLPYDW